MVNGVASGVASGVVSGVGSGAESGAESGVESGAESDVGEVDSPAVGLGCFRRQIPRGNSQAVRRRCRSSPRIRR